MIETSKLKLDQNMVKYHTKEQLKQLVALFKLVGFTDPVMIDKKMNVRAGKGSVLAAIEAGMKKLPCVYLENLTERQIKAFMLMDNKVNESAWNRNAMGDLFAEIPGFNFEEFHMKFDEFYPTNLNALSLSERFGQPPFSVLDGRKKEWQDRKQEWLSIGIQSELGREGGLMSPSKLYLMIGNGTSVFDPVTTELMVRWFTNKGDKILDPFAGGSVRGVVSGILGREYTGIDLRKEQIEANDVNLKEIEKNIKVQIHPKWLVGNSVKAYTMLAGKKFNFILTCPPYFDLEVYSKDPEDISNQSWEDFQQNYELIIQSCSELLENNSFACFVVSPTRDGKGFLRDLPSITTQLCEKYGMKLYNSLVVLRMVGTASIRTSAHFPKKRKVMSTHDNVLIFYKGDTNNIKPLLEELTYSLKPETETKDEPE